jgi:uncharacterized protein (TIGR02118 family)
MFKTCGFQTRLAGRDHQHFMDHWLNVHAPISKEVRDLRGYVLNEVLAELPVPGAEPIVWPVETDGVAQIWFDHAGGLGVMADDPAVQRWFSDGPNYCGQRIGYTVRELLTRDSAAPGGGIKAIIVAARDPGETADGFVARLSGASGAIAVSAIVDVNASVGIPSFVPPPADAIVELWGDSRAAVTAGLADWAGRARPGAARAVLASETVMVAPRR